MSNRIETIRKRKEILDRQLKELETKRRLAERKDMTRRHILLGKLVEERMAADDAFRKDMHKRLDAALTREIDRKVFGFEAAAARS